MRDHFFVLCVSLAVVVGCQSGTEVANSNLADKSSAAEEKQTVGKTESNTEESTSAEPANVASSEVKEPVPIKVEDTPEQVCQQFLKLLQDEDVQAANMLCTRKARVLTKRYELPLTFPGKADASFRVGKVKFATSKEELAQVICKIGEDDEQSEIGWMLKHESRGWKICGMLLPAGEDEVMDFISFENATDLDRIKAMLSGDPKSNDLQATTVAPDDSTLPN